ncbi:PH domain-like protein [Cryptosporidium tyzzeri]|nr:PH domain-like protein [Cryptosporidium tyzzeri]
MTGELVSRLQRVRAQMDNHAVHYVGGGESSRADARNSVFKLKWKFATMPDKNKIKIAMDMHGHVLGEQDPSDDEAWGNWNTSKLKQCKMVGKLEQTKDIGSVLVSEFENVTKTEKEMEAKGLINTPYLNEKTETEKRDEILREEEASSSSSDDEYSQKDKNGVQRFNTLQKEFMLQNLTEWYREIVKQYKEGIKLIKVAKSGKKFIRIVKLTDSGFFEISSVTSNSDRMVHLTDIKNIELGIDAPEFKECKKVNPKNPPVPGLSCVINLPDKKTLCLMFNDEEARNSFVFMIRVLKRKFENYKSK